MDYLLLLVPLLLGIILWYSRQLNKKQKLVEKLVFEKHDLESLRKEELKNYFEEEWKQEEQQLKDKLKIKTDGLEKEWQGAFQKHHMQLSTLDNEIQKYETVLAEKEKRYNEVNQDLDLYREGKIKEIDGAAAEYEQRKRIEIEQILKQAELNANSSFNNQVDSYIAQKAQMQTEIDQIKAELEIERSKRAAINEEIREAEEKEKYNELHSVQLTENEKEDIHFLLSLEDRLHNKQALYKLVWSTYLQQAYKNTFNNILGSRDPRNVIYCIENINTGKKYIGKTSAEVSKRWTEHIKTSLNIGSIKSTNIHKALYNHWDEFIFYIITETEKDKLSEMEKYYINFYESDKYGYNIKAGG